MISAFALALRQLADPRVVAIMLKCVGIAFLAFAVIGTVSWYALDMVLAAFGFEDNLGESAGAVRGLAALVIILIGGWLLWRIIALAVLQFYADEFVAAVEARHYPAAFARARKLGWRSELRVALRGALRALGYNLLALPLALVLLVTGFGTVFVFIAVNAILLGRELTEMVWFRHAHAPDAPLPVSAGARFLFGAGVAVLLTVPFVNFLAPFLGAAAATHLVHRSGAIDHAP